MRVYVRFGRTTQRDRTPLSEFFQIMQQLYDERRLIEGVHFRFEGSMLHFRFSQLYTTSLQKYRQVFFRETPDKESLVTELEQLYEPKDGKKRFRNIRFRPDIEEEKGNATMSVSGSASVPYMLLQE